MQKTRRSLHCFALPIALAASTAPYAAQDGILIEAEAYTKKVSDEKSFAKPARELAASGRRSVFRFFLKGHVVYSFTVPSTGQYSGWLRYGAKHDQSIGVVVDPKGTPEFKRADTPATGGFIGPGVWKWARLFKQKLSRGKHTLALSNASMRIDCIYITGGDDVPTDDIITTKPKVKPLRPDVMAKVEKPLCPVTPDWLDNATDYQQPAWFGEYRVHAHTRLGPNWMKRDIFYKAAQGFKDMGCHTFARHIKSGSEGTWWQSSVGAVHPLAEDRNIAKEIIDNAHKIGSRILVYHRHMEDDWVVKEHPDWAARTPEGELIKKRGYKACFNSPYGDFVQTRLLELIDMGADAFFFDEVHFPKVGCWCGHCKRMFREETGLDHPTRADPEDLVWHKLIEFNNLSIERVFLGWRKAIHERNPEVVMLVGSNTWPTIAERHMTGRLFRITDSMKTEFSLPARVGGNAIFYSDPTVKPFEKDAKMALGYTLARDACDGRPAHIWTHGLINEASAVYASAGMMTHGCIANLDVPEATIGNNPIFDPAFALGNKVSKYFADTKPLRWAAVHYSEHARDQFLVDESARVKQVLYPTYGAYTALLRARLPVGILTDTQLEQGLLKGYKVLFLPAPKFLTARMRDAVAKFRSGGGLVVEQRPAWLWHELNDGSQKAAAAFVRAIADEAAPAPVQAFGGPEKMHVVSHASEGRLTVSCANDFSWVYTGRKTTRDGKRIDLSPYLDPPPDCEGVEVLLGGMEMPKRVVEGVTDRILEVKATDQGLKIELPRFGPIAIVAVDFE